MEQVPVQPGEAALGLGTIALYAIFLALLVIPYWLLWKRTGHSGAWGLLMLVPVVNVISLWVLAFKDWPALRGRGQ